MCAALESKTNLNQTKINRVILYRIALKNNKQQNINKTCKEIKKQYFLN